MHQSQYAGLVCEEPLGIRLNRNATVTLDSPQVRLLNVLHACTEPLSRPRLNQATCPLPSLVESHKPLSNTAPVTCAPFTTGAIFIYLPCFIPLSPALALPQATHPLCRLVLLVADVC